MNGRIKNECRFNIFTAAGVGLMIGAFVGAGAVTAIAEGPCSSLREFEKEKKTLTERTPLQELSIHPSPPKL